MRFASPRDWIKQIFRTSGRRQRRGRPRPPGGAGARDYAAGVLPRQPMLRPRQTGAIHDRGRVGIERLAHGSVWRLRIGDSHPSAPSLSTPSRTPPRTVDSPAFAGALSRSRPEPIGLADEIPTPDIRMSAEESARAFAPAQSALSAPEVESDGHGLASDIESARSLATRLKGLLPRLRTLDAHVPAHAQHGVQHEARGVGLVARMRR